MTLVQERLAGCTAESLDSYLRGLGFFLLAGEVEPSVRAWWDEDGVLHLASTRVLAELVEQVVDRVFDKPPPLRTPWRPVARGRDFAELRNMAAEDELDWFDASILVLSDSSRQNNPLLGEGASFGRGEIANGYEIALSKLRKVSRTSAEHALIDLVLGRSIERGAARRLTIGKKILSAYQSGRAALPGSSADDVKPESQRPRTLAWDVVLVLRGTRLFRGVAAKRADPNARAQAAFPLVVQSRPLGTGPGGVTDQRQDPPKTAEVLAPLWTAPCSARVLAHLLPSARLRSRRGIARDTLDAVLIQSARAAQGLGFDRLVRFPLIPPDPKKPARYAARRGEVRALGQRAAVLALYEIVPFLRNVEREGARRGGSEPPSLAIARRRLDDALAAFSQPPAPALPHTDAARTQDALIALAVLQTPASRAVPDRERSFEPPRLSSEWFRHADDGSEACRLARSLVAGLSDGETCLLRETLLPQHRESGRFLLDATRMPPDLERVSNPLAVLVELALTALRRTRPENLARAGSTSFSALASLLAGAMGEVEERRLALLCAAFAGVHPTNPPPARPEDPLGVGIGADVARLLLAAQPAAEDETAKDALERTTALASLLLAGRVDVARTMADRELRRRGLDLLPAPPPRAPTPRPQALALAVLLSFDAEARSALERVVSISPTTPHEQGGVA